MFLASVILLSSAVGTNESATYLREEFEAYASVALNRPVDGLDYYADEGVIAGGIRYSHPSGFYAASQLLSGEGDGVSLPKERATNLESALGWAWHFSEHDLSLELQDYRQRQSAYPSQDYSGAALHYRFRKFSAELGYESDRPFYYRPLDRYFEYNKRRFVLAYRVPVSKNASFRLAAGRHDIDRVDIEYSHVSLRLDSSWGRWNGWMGYSVASDDLEAFYSDEVELRPITIGVAAAFDLD